MSLGTRIASMRGYRRMTQEQLGGLVGVSKQTISTWEHDRSKPDANDIVAMCLAMRCTSDYLLGLVDEPMDHVKW